MLQLRSVVKEQANRILISLIHKNRKLFLREPLDDWGMALLDPLSRHDLLEVIEDRYGYRSSIISGQLPVSKWHELFEDSTVADAILDRLVHNAYHFELKGPTKRRNQENERQTNTSSPSPMGEGEAGNHNATNPKPCLKKKLMNQPDL